MARQHQYRRLALVFTTWKAVLLLITALSPGPGYDTSALIASSPDSFRHFEYKNWPWVDRFSLNFLRWDAIYFIKSAQRGYLYEQEWAFSWAYSLIIKTLATLIPGNDVQSLRPYVWSAVIVSNICHLVSVLVLYRLLNVLLGRRYNGPIPFVASVLHILAPAGMFLSAPYAESAFSAINLTGMLLYAQARTVEQSGEKQTIYEDALILGAGMLFTLGTWVRSNGLLSGVLFVFDAVTSLPQLFRMQLRTNVIRRLTITCVSGIILGLGFAFPQYVAYREFCNSEFSAKTRPWCYKTVPSIYTWVQSNYWNVGFLRYWTLSNLPLFAIAGPMLWLLIQSSIEHLRYSTRQPDKPSQAQAEGKSRRMELVITTFGSLPQLALPQLVLAASAATNFHVQVINRLSSGYPIWYLAVARWIIAQNKARRSKKGYMLSQWICRGLIIYAMVQGALFANFLPPA